jgi:hypothetical protein
MVLELSEPCVSLLFLMPCSMAQQTPQHPLTEHDWESAVKLAEKLAAAADLDPNQPAAAAHMKKLQHLERNMLLRLAAGTKMTAASWKKVIKNKVGVLHLHSALSLTALSGCDDAKHGCLASAELRQAGTA